VALSVSLLVPVHTNMIGISGTAAPGQVPFSKCSITLVRWAARCR
jgi:hypothetical protein